LKGLLIISFHDDGEWREQIEMVAPFPAAGVDAAGAAEHAAQMESSIARSGGLDKLTWRALHRTGFGLPC